MFCETQTIHQVVIFPFMKNLLQEENISNLFGHASLSVLINCTCVMSEFKDSGDLWRT